MVHVCKGLCLVGVDLVSLLAPYRVYSYTLWGVHTLKYALSCSAQCLALTSQLLRRSTRLIIMVVGQTL